MATFAEALSSISWAATAALGASGSALAVLAGANAIVILTATWLLSPRAT